MRRGIVITAGRDMVLMHDIESSATIHAKRSLFDGPVKKGDVFEYRLTLHIERRHKAERESDD